MSVPSKLISPEVGSSCRVIRRPVVVLPQPDSPTRPRDWPFFSSNETPSTAWTWATVRRITPPDLTGKYFLRSRTSRRVSLPTPPAGVWAGSTSELVTMLILPSKRVRVDFCQLRNHLTRRRVNEVGSDLRQHFLGVDLARIGQVTALQVVLTAVAGHQVGQGGPAQVTWHLVDVGTARVERAALGRVEQARGVPGDRDQPGVGVTADVGDAAHQAPRVRHLGVGEDLAGGAVLDRAAAVHDHRGVGELGDDAEVVGDDDDRGVELPLQV